MIDQAAQLRLLSVQKGAPAKPGTAASAALVSEPKSPCQSIAVTSGKGGVGKSNIAILLAQALARCKKRVLLLDADLGLANIHILLGMNPRHNLAHAVRGECAIDETLCPGPDGVTLIPGASGVEAMANLDALSLESLVRSLAVVEARHDFMIIDVGAGIGQTTMRIGASADRALLVLTPEPTSLADAYATAKVLFSRGLDRISVVVNMASTDKEGVEIFEKLRTLVKKFLKRDILLTGILPVDKDIPRFVRAQRNLFQEKPNAAVVIRMQGYARALCGMSPKESVSFFSRLFKKS